MHTRPFSYLFSISYFGPPFKGWAKQPGQSTVEGKLERVFRFVLGHGDFRFIGSSRTDSGVSCRKGFIQVFMREEVDFFFLLEELNRNLGGEIRLNSVQSINRNFNLIQSVSKKTYRYFFSDSEVFHPFAASFLTPVSKINPLEKMRLNAGLMIGKHDFRAFCKISGNKTNFIRQISESRVLENQDFNSGFFPENGYCFEVTGSGFLHHQVRKMMSAIWYFSPDEIRQRLESPCLEWIPVPTAPANGLILWDTDLDLIGSME